jgi:hypothetical protein
MQDIDMGDMLDELEDCWGDPEQIRKVMEKYPDFDF